MMERRRFQVRGTKLFRIVLLLLTFVCVGTACGRGEEVSSETTAETVTAVHTTVQTEQSASYSVQITSVQTTSVPPQTALSVPAQSEPQIIADGFSAAVLSLPQGYRLHASADIANKPYRTAEGSLVLSVKRADEAEKLVWLDSRSGAVLGEISVDPRLHGVENGVVISSGIASYGHPLGIRVKSYGYLIVLTGGYIAVDHDFQPFRTVYFAELPWFRWEWTNLGGNTGDLYDVSEDFRYLLSFDMNQYLIDMESGKEILAQRSAFDRVIDLTGVGTLRIFRHTLTADNVLWAVAELNGIYGVFRYGLDSREYAFWPLPEPSDTAGTPYPVISQQVPDEFAALIKMEAGNRNQTDVPPPGMHLARVIDYIGDMLIAATDDGETVFCSPQTGTVRSVLGKLIAVSADGAAVVQTDGKLLLCTPIS